MKAYYCFGRKDFCDRDSKDCGDCEHYDGSGGEFREVKYNKLVRDKIPEIIESNGQKAKFRVLAEDEYLSYLEKKLDEECAEFHESKSIEELADIFEVLKELVAVCGASPSAFMKVCNQKCKERGGFSKRICLIEVEE